jgi:putative transposase
MPRRKRIAKGNIVYHVLNRANGRLRIFKKDRDFEAFEQILGEGIERFEMRLCGYCIMSNHWHLVLWPVHDGDLSSFMKWITVTHSHRWHSSHGTVGIGHLYQGRYKSFPVQKEAYYLTLMRYVESNPVRAGLVRRSRDWVSSSMAIRLGAEKPLKLCDGPLGLPTLAAMEQGIPVIAVRENHNLMRNELGGLGFKKGKYFVAQNYPEAVGIMTALKAGVALDSVRRPLAETKVVCERIQEPSRAESEIKTGR